MRKEIKKDSSWADRHHHYIHYTPVVGRSFRLSVGEADYAKVPSAQTAQSLPWNRANPRGSKRNRGPGPSRRVRRTLAGRMSLQRAVASLTISFSGTLLSTSQSKEKKKGVEKRRVLELRTIPNPKTKRLIRIPQLNGIAFKGRRRRGWCWWWSPLCSANFGSHRSQYWPARQI